MKKRVLLLTIFIVALISLGTVNAESDLTPGLKSKSGFYQIGHIKFRLKAKDCSTRHYKSNKTRVWYSFFPADEKPESKPLFVFLNGGPGCATSTNLFAMNTAPYTLDRASVKTGEIFAENENSWTEMGNLLYIDAPNTGFSYMLSNTPGWNTLGIGKEFFGGDNFNSFIDADQILRVVIKFLSDHSEIRKNEVIFVGESYSGVRVSTILNLLLFYRDYNDGKKVFMDKSLPGVIKEHLDFVMPEVKEIYTPEDITFQFSRQILIQPQIAGKYQSEAQDEMYSRPDSIINNLKPNNKGKDYAWFKNKYGADAATMLYMHFIDRDQYNYKKYWSWSDHNEEFAMKALMDTNALSKITECNVEKIKYMKPDERRKALRFVFDKNDAKWFKNPYAKEIIGKLKPVAKIWIESIPHNLVHPIPSMYKDKLESLDEKLGKLNEFDSYLVGTNIYNFLGFYFNSGIMRGGLNDIYQIEAGSSIRYGRMFLENLTLVDTFMTDAKLDLVIYSPTLPAQFDSSKGRYTDVVKEVVAKRGNAEKDGEFTVFYKPGSIKGIKEVPVSKTINWPHYETSGHSVSSSQPKKLLKDVDEWVNGYRQK